MTPRSSARALIPVPSFDLTLRNAVVSATYSAIYLANVLAMTNCRKDFRSSPPKTALSPFVFVTISEVISVVVRFDNVTVMKDPYTFGSISPRRFARHSSALNTLVSQFHACSLFRCLGRLTVWGLPRLPLLTACYQPVAMRSGPTRLPTSTPAS